MTATLPTLSSAVPLRKFLAAPTTTQDLAIVPAQTEANIDKIGRTVDALGCTRSTGAGWTRTTCREFHLLGQGQLSLLTNFGVLDILLRLHDGRGYDALLPHTDVVTDGSLSVRTLNLRTLIQMKRAAGRPKDLLVVAILEKMNTLKAAVQS